MGSGTVRRVDRGDRRLDGGHRDFGTCGRRFHCFVEAGHHLLVEFGNLLFDQLVHLALRRGGDVVKAVALGARAVLIGRAYIWPLAVGRFFWLQVRLLKTRKYLARYGLWFERRRQSA